MYRATYFYVPLNLSHYLIYNIFIFKYDFTTLILYIHAHILNILLFCKKKNSDLKIIFIENTKRSNINVCLYKIEKSKNEHRNEIKYLKFDLG